jgi:hypothetical protein
MTARKRRTVTARRVTERERITEDVAITEDDTLTELPAAGGGYRSINAGWAEGAIPGAIHRAGGWDTAAITTGERQWLRAQRDTQQERAEELISDWACSVPPGTPVPQWLTDATSNMLRAGPGATPLQLKWGRDI